MRLSHLFAVTAILLSAGMASADDEAPRTLSVTGSGVVQAAPDMAEITVGVSTIAPTAREALDSNNDQTMKVFTFLRSAGVEDKDMQATNLSVSPRYRNTRSNENGPPEIIGYMVNNSVRVAVRDLASFGSVIDGVVTAGGNNINGIQFDVSERKALTREASANAVRDAIEQAENIAAAAGVKLGRILSISQSGNSRPPQAMLVRSMAAESVPIAAGELSIGASAAIVFAIK